MNVITATAEHLDQLTPLFNGYRMFYKQADNLEGARDFLNKRFELKDSVIFLAISNAGQGMGFTQLYPSFSSVTMQRTYILNDLFVSENFRGKKTGEALMERAKQFAREMGSRGLTLETDVDNPAQKLYKRLGWVKDTAVNHYTWEI